jgi:hypothetical protein
MEINHMFQAQPGTPVFISWILFAIKAAEFPTLLRQSTEKARAHKRKCNQIVSAYQGRLKWLTSLALFRPRLMIFTSFFLALLLVWFFLIIFSYYFPQLAIAQALNSAIAATYLYAVILSLIVILLSFVFIFVTSFSFSWVYAAFKYILPQPQQRLASRIDREDEGYFYINKDEAERIIATVIRHVLSNPEWYAQAIVIKPPGDEMKSAKYANFLFFGQLVEGRATVGSSLERWNWVTELYRTTDFFEPAKLKGLAATKKFGESVITKLIAVSENAELSVPSLHDALNSGVTKLGERFKYDARNIGTMCLWNRFLINTKLRTNYEVLKRRLNSLEVFDQPPAQANILQLIKLMATRRIWKIDWQYVEFAFAPWQCVFLLRSGILKTDLTKFSGWDDDFEWFRNDALREISHLVQRSLQVLNDEEKKKIKTILNSDIDFPSATVLADTFLWMVGSQGCRYNNCGEMTGSRGQLCPLGRFGICKLVPGKKLFTYKSNEFVVE